MIRRIVFATAVLALIAAAPTYAQQATEADAEEIRQEVLSNLEAEGLAKGVPLDRIAAALERRAQALDQVFAAFGDQSGSLDAQTAQLGAEAIESGIGADVLAAVFESAPQDRRLVAVAALQALVDEGRAPQQALEAVQAAMERRPDVPVFDALGISPENLPTPANRPDHAGQRGPPEGRGPPNE